MTESKKILVPDEPGELAEQLSAAFEHEYIEILTAPKDGIRIVELIRAHAPELVILHVFLPRLDGVGVMESVADQASRPVFVVISDFESPALKRELLRAGAAAYFTKSADAGEMARTIRELLKLKEKRNSDMMMQTGRMSDDIEVRVTEILHQIGVPAHIKGYHYLRDAIIKAVNNPEIINAVTKQLYPSVAKRFETTSSRVERAIRHAIEVAWDRGDVDILNSYFGYTIHNSRGKPTNSEFVAMISDNLRLQLKNAS